MRETILRQAAALLAVCPLLACGSPDPGSAQATDDQVERIAGGEDWATDFSKHSVPLSQIRSGGPPKDGIPALDDPEFVSADHADRWLQPRDPVMVVRQGEAVKAYPLSILMWHEIVNDRVGDLPVAVTFCPLCNTALVFDRRVGGRLLDFGTTGRLRHSDLVMYDRQTESWWQQASGEAIVGDLTGTTLEFVPANTLAWETARELHRDLRVLSRETGYDRDYGTNPYVGYDRRDAPYRRLFSGRPDGRLPAMERVVSVDLGDGWSIPFGELSEARVVEDSVEGTSFVVFWAPGAASALDEGRVSEGRDVGQVAVYRRTVEGRTLTFAPAGSGHAPRFRFRDRETGSIWDLAGRAVAGPLEGATLEPVAHGTPFWFAWAAIRPDTEIRRTGGR